MQVAEVVIEYGLAVSGAKSGVIFLLDEPGENLEILHYFGYSDQQVKNWLKFPLTASVPVAEAVRTGTSIYVDSQEKLAELYPELYPTSKYRASVSLPLVVEDKTIGGIGLSFAEAQSFSGEDRSFLLSLARLCTQALERAHLYELEKKARTEAEAAQQRLTLLAETQERNRLAQDLHDNIAQTLGYLNLQITIVNNQLNKGQLAEVQNKLEELKQVVNEAYTDVREEIFNLRARITAELPFLETLRSYLSKYKKFYKLDVQLLLEADEAIFTFSSEVGAQIIRIIQEALINVRKHAQTDQATIRLSQQEDHIRISIEDQGEGFNLEEMLEKGNSFGLKIIQERAERIGSPLKINSIPGEGTTIILYYSLGNEK
jgi:nitrate/nitrite-specific signal transduction histidine kinase